MKWATKEKDRLYMSDFDKEVKRLKDEMGIE